MKGALLFSALLLACCCGPLMVDKRPAMNAVGAAGFLVAFCLVFAAFLLT